MATPTTNSVPVTEVDPSLLDPLVRPLVDSDIPPHGGGTKWGGSVGTGVVLDYSFPQGPTHFISDYFGGEPSNGYTLSPDEENAVRQALAEASESANVIFVEVAESASLVGELRFAGVNDISFGFAHAYLPFPAPEGGDVWFSNAWNPLADEIPKGSYDYLTILHELGHALGLTHPFEGSDPLDPEFDHNAYTVMSYSTVEGDTITAADFYPTTYMYLDLLALQALYGQSTTANVGNTTYTYTDMAQYWETINDISGVDTIVYVSSTSGLIDLSNEISHFSQLGLAINFNNDTSTRDTVAIGPGVIIENATGGNGNDTILGNDVGNLLSGRAGNDSLLGGAGNDTPDGGDGNDTVGGGGGNDVVAGGNGNDSLTAALGDDSLLGDAGDDTLAGGAGNDRLLGGDGNDSVLGGAGNDTFNGGNGNDSLTGGGGNDLLFGRAGDDSLASDEGNDLLLGAAGNDVVDGGDGSDVIRAGTGNDTLSGGNGNDFILGKSGNDSLIGEDGNDTLAGGAGDDTLDGGAGSDIFRYFATSLGVLGIVAGEADVILGIEAGDRLKIRDTLATELTVGGTLIGDGDTLGGAIDGSNNIAFDDINDLLMIDINGGGFSANDDFSIELVGVASVIYNAEDSTFSFTLDSL